MGKNDLPRKCELCRYFFLYNVILSVKPKEKSCQRHLLIQGKYICVSMYLYTATVQNHDRYTVQIHSNRHTFKYIEDHFKWLTDLQSNKLDKKCNGNQS